MASDMVLYAGAILLSIPVAFFWQGLVIWYLGHPLVTRDAKNRFYRINIFTYNLSMFSWGLSYLINGTREVMVLIQIMIILGAVSATLISTHHIYRKFALEKQIRLMPLASILNVIGVALIPGTILYISLITWRGSFYLGVLSDSENPFFQIIDNIKWLAEDYYLQFVFITYLQGLLIYPLPTLFGTLAPNFFRKQ